jgi:hypothetical protein
MIANGIIHLALKGGSKYQEKKEEKEKERERKRKKKAIDLK